MRVHVRPERLKFELACRGLDQRQFAELAGISPASISRMLGGRGVNPMTLKKLVGTLARIPALLGTESLVLSPTDSPADTTN